VVEVVEGEVGSGLGGVVDVRHKKSFLALLALAVGRNPNFDFLRDLFFVSLIDYTQIIPQRVSNRADTPEKIFSFFKKFFEKMMGRCWWDDLT
jgi:hypothetical protein